MPARGKGSLPRTTDRACSPFLTLLPDGSWGLVSATLRYRSYGDPQLAKVCIEELGTHNVGIALQELSRRLPGWGRGMALTGGVGGADGMVTQSVQPPVTVETEE